MRFDDLQWVHENDVSIIEFFSLGADIKKPSTLFDVKGERKFVRFVNDKGVTRVFQLDASFRECVNIRFILQNGKHVFLTDKGLDLLFSQR